MRFPPEGAAPQHPLLPPAEEIPGFRLGERWAFHAPLPGESGRLTVADDVLVLRGKGWGPETPRRSPSSPATTLTRSRSTSSLEGPVEAGLLLFFNGRLFCGMGIDGAGMRSYSGGIRTHWREPAPAGRRLSLRLRNDHHIVTGWWREQGGEWTRHGVRYETSGYHANTIGDLLSLRPAIYAAGDGSARFRDLRYRRLA